MAGDTSTTEAYAASLMSAASGDEAEQSANPVRPEGIALAVLFGVLSVLGAAGNCLTILAVLTNRHLRSQVSSYLIMNLAVADMMVFVFIEPFFAVSAVTAYWPFSISLCGAIGALVVQHMLVSVCSMAAIAVNRYYSVVNYRVYHLKFTRWRTLCLCLATWLPGVCFLLPVVLTPNVAAYDAYYGVCIFVSASSSFARATSLLTATTILASMVASSLCYQQIFRAVRASKKRVQNQAPVVARRESEHGGGAVQLSTDVDRPMDGGIKRLSKPVLAGAGAIKALTPQLSRAEIKVSLNLFMVFAVFCLCWLPLTVLIFVQNAGGPRENGADFDDRSIPGWTWQLAYKLVLFNSTLNIFIYAWRNPKFKTAYMKVLKCQKGY